MKKFSLLVFGLLSLCLTVSQSRAQNEIWDITGLAEKSDVVCVASFQSAEPASDELARKNPTEFASVDDLIASSDHYFSTAIYTLKMQQIWKGALPSNEIKLRSVKEEHYNLYSNRSNDGFQKGRLYLIFARRFEKTSDFASAINNYGLGFSSAFLIENVASEIKPQMPLPEKILRQFTFSLSSIDAQVQKTALGQLWALSYLFWDRPPENWPKNIDVKSWRRYARKKVVPQVMRLTKSPDESVREAAFGTAARLQLLEAIPDIIAWSESDLPSASQMNWNLLAYRNWNAARLLLPQLQNKKLPMRVAIIEYMEELGDRRALPYLIDLLNDGDVRERLPYALWILSGLPKDYAIANAHDNNAQHLVFWRDWAKTHQSELKKLRVQALTSFKKH